ncbi:Na(+)/dicarboxylate symporter [Actinomyces bovis]|uniref:Sodium-dependent dicarboxylate transporter SdcS n=1 Tax=Actinomyces bovis TaxID=1658 RepID=A0ABY1VRQ4_9ACTO|nr:DASS family sodium-coupled anion symporter [Actinomyces bovis]SPT53713.1 Na(+)/dicarboxylate symporter [Actinomyces bovis]VEG55857.1 Na(+)/dicarboxylate symporter [Actinomyces israelii]
MSTPITHESTSHSIGNEAPPPNTGERRRQMIGLVGGVVLAIIAYYLMPADAIEKVIAAAGPEKAKGMTEHGLRLTAAAAVLMGAWWMTEAIPLAATALVPLVLFPLLKADNFKATAAPYASGTIFLFMGGFMLALAMQRWNLHRRIALLTVLAVGVKPRRLVLGFMLATGFISMWVSNTATAVMMLPIGTSILMLTGQLAAGEKKQNKFATGLMLGIAYAASIGSLGTIIGTPPNTLLIAHLKESHGVIIGFGQWMLMGVPLAVVFLLVAWWLLTYVLFKPELEEIPGGKDVIKDELRQMGRWSSGEILVGLVFVAAALSWSLLPALLPKSGLNDEVIAMVVALVLFILPAPGHHGVRLLDWESAKELPWDVLLLFGGGLALSAEFSKQGLSLWIGEGAKSLSTLPVVLVVAAVTMLVIFLTELTSNTATAAAFLPIMGGVAVGIGADPLLLVVPVALAATCAFMLPVATPPNAIAYGSGYVQMGSMVKAGLWLNVIGVVLITVTVMLLGVPVLGIQL